MTDQPLRIPLTELRRSIDLLMDHLEATADGGTIQVHRDYFWSISQEEMYDLTQTPVDLTLGQLSWSWAHLMDLRADPDRAIGYHLVWLSEVLRAVGQQMP
ncbi:hypothetical protein ACFO5K_04840 [Nocardia halotolerans]|uniref:Uncharacterized protein n=1 Tax=Nocardia halotolerans TaxID=1755878 RepID=A0ABV8VDJ7_9NOCA